MFSFASADAFDPLLWSGMLVVMTLAALGLTSWWERRARHHHRRHGDSVVRTDRGATPSVR
jgi:hypothetical protein